MEWTIPIIVAAVVLCGIAAVVFLQRPLRARSEEREFRRAIEAFKVQREQLEAKFFDLARMQGKPRGLTWIECDWQDGVAFARGVSDRLLTAFVAVNIRFEAVEGGDMEGVAAVANVREAAAVFHYQDRRWGTGGRALFNMNPRDAVTRLEGQFEPVCTEVPASRRV